MNWADLFERAETYETDAETIRERLAAHRERASDGANREGVDG
ncbi:hypothetical protein [Halorussus sp. MSC15.2]|nr:hypothetical protein [Halorussus sp. MSC15.2]